MRDKTDFREHHEECCGRSVNIPKYEISGGLTATPHEFPWIVRVLGGCAGGNCAGSLISPSFVLSSFHCTVAPPDVTKPCDHSDGKALAYLGQHNIDMKLLKSYYSIPIIDVKYPKKAGQHVDFGGVEEHDFALLILQRPARYSDHVRPICLPAQGQEFHNKIATAAGWGMFSKGSPQSPELRKVQLHVDLKKYAYCKMFGTQVKWNLLGEAEDPCSGDSGCSKSKTP